MTSPKTYAGIFVALLALTAVTVGAAFIDLGPLNTPVALGIAFLKASLVVLFFMHVKLSERLIQIFIVIGLYWLSIMLLLTFADTATRIWAPSWTF